MAATFSYTDGARAAFASCLPCFTGSRSKPISNPSVGAALSDPRSTTHGYPSSGNDLEHLLRDSDSDALSLHSHPGVVARRGAKHRRRRPKFSLTLFGYTLFGRPPIYLDDDGDGDGDGPSGRQARTLVTASSSTLDSDAAPLDASTIERMASPDHFAALAAQRLQLQAAEGARRKAERRARREERKARARAEALMSVASGSPRTDTDTFEGFQGSGDGAISVPLPPHRVAPSVVSGRPDPDGLGGDGVGDSHSGDADDADLGGELYARKKSPSAALSVSGSESRSRTSASLSTGDASHINTFPSRTTHQSVSYPQTEMHLPTSVKKKPRRTSKRTSIVSSATSQSTSTAPYTPVESLMEAPAVAAFPIPQERYLRDGERADFPSVGLPGKRGISSLDPRTFLAQQG